MLEIQKALQLKAELDALRPIDKEKEAIVLQKLRLDWNYHSNHLEGNSLTFGETKALILFGITAQGKSLKDHFEITGHDEAIKWVIDIVKGDRPLTENFIRELHTLLLKEPYEVDAITPDGQPTKRKIEIGKYKTVPNHVLTKTGEIFRFATPEETPSKMNDLMEWYREKIENTEVNPVILAAEFHYRFIRIHPFDDGNGRVARILMNFILMKFGFPPTIIKTEDKENYFAVLRLADSGQIEPFIEYIAQNLVRSLEIMLAGAKGENIEEPDDLDKEIALLEQKIKGVEIKNKNDIKITKSRESILKLYDNSIRRLFQETIHFSEKLFHKFYLRNGWLVFVNVLGKEKISHQNLDILRNEIDGDIFSIDFHYTFMGFKTYGFEKFIFSPKIVIRFEEHKYKILFNNEKKQIVKLYSEQLTNEEINQIVKAEMKRHKDFIEEKIKEVQSKKT